MAMPKKKGGIFGARMFSSKSGSKCSFEALKNSEMLVKVDENATIDHLLWQSDYFFNLTSGLASSLLGLRL